MSAIFSGIVQGIQAVGDRATAIMPALKAATTAAKETTAAVQEAVQAITAANASGMDLAPGSDPVTGAGGIGSSSGGTSTGGAMELAEALKGLAR